MCFNEMFVRNRDKYLNISVAMGIPTKISLKRDSEK